jgi:GNAT superfamily N-acetyltransferase
MNMRDIITLIEDVSSVGNNDAEISSILRDLRYKAESVDGIFDFWVDEDGISIEQISFPVESQRRGMGSEIMARVAEVADQFHRRVKLEAQSYKKFDRREIGQAALEKFYAKFGFAKTGEISAEGQPVMVREPGQGSVGL